MTFNLFSDNRTLIKKLESVNRLKNFAFSALSIKELNKFLKNNGSPDLIYVDISKLDAAAVKKILTALAKKKGHTWGIIDPAGKISDPALLFHDGASDYIGKAILNSGIGAKRLSRVASWQKNEDAEEDANKADSGGLNLLLSGRDWKNIRQETEYTFCFMFVELDLTYEWKNKSGKVHLSKVSGDFHTFIKKCVEPLQGNVWLWGEFGGIILFPYDGETADAILASYRLILNRTMISVEDFSFSTLVSFRIALDIGNTVYKKRGDTGNIVADTINFMFHLGKKYVPPGNFYLTERIAGHIPPGMRKCFIKAGQFEGVELQRMILPED
ncbi:MAG: hypothetical protein E4H36_03265 [Spirochaetales bacterium]|nr:MAG: hypothetical protein E4H36_03265 [Spirochaetales bacterium]